MMRETLGLAPSVPAGAFAVPPDGGEQLVFRAAPVPCLVTITVSPATGASSFTMGTWVFPVDYVIPMHYHAHQHEILYFTRGNFASTVNGVEIAVRPGTTINLPPGSWHDVRNTGGEPGHMVWFISPPGLEGFVREASVPPGAAWSRLPPSTIEELGKKYGVVMGPDWGKAYPSAPSGPSENPPANELVRRAHAILGEEIERWRGSGRA
jgi:quercetin dioxygenase-like cupin family protein